MLVAYDGSARAAADVDRAVQLCLRTRAALTVVVTRNPLPAFAAAWVPMAPPATFDDACRCAVLEIVPPGVGVRFLIAERSCSGSLMESVARRLACDTVVCGRRIGRRLRRAGLRVLDAPAAERRGRVTTAGGPAHVGSV